LAKQMKRGRRHVAERGTKKHTKRPVKSTRRLKKEVAKETDEEEKFTYQKTFNQNDDD